MPRRNPGAPVQRLSVVARGRCRRMVALLLLVSGLLLGVVASAFAESTTFTLTGGAEQEFGFSFIAGANRYEADLRAG